MSLDLSQISDSSSQSDSFASEEEIFFSIDRDIDAATEITVQERKLTKLELKLKRFESDTELRNLLAKVFTIVIAFWLLSVLYVITGNYLKYHLSDSVVITLLTTSTVNVIGMMLIILNNLFPSYKKKKRKTKKPAN